ncbi:NAD(P)/FAD-dependent oxidoreductase [Gordonia sp. HY002]|uniref:flavin-containing monooxygenase n=1 Tax=Gordonia zhenghanii TaxID=2911516 RepID=UPI001EF1013D|nr:NAD(P)/FAD-dependent oxidoreductase [Gordonia zhenghanii]MCF8568777.1 NAD(P)/FAD-dependent oxidoreductase [Gordonia zhenghanii]MCF8606110.1 NAD(P)/FAD-dependent oxidoreductase [Gordonia zhenghanii]
MPDREFVERAVSAADVNALRMALFQATGDLEVAAVKAQRVAGLVADTVVVADADADLIRSKAVDYLIAGDLADEAHVPSQDEISDLIRMAEARDLEAEDLFMRRQILSFPDWTFQREPKGETSAPDGYSVAIVGAGFSGIAMGVQLARLGIEFTIYERRSEIGGVWSINTYPDVRVDTLSASYEYSFEKKYPWTEYFARQSEVRAYLDHVARKHGVFEHIVFDADVTAAEFADDVKTWSLTVSVADQEPTTVVANVVVAASGLFATPRELSVEGAADFSGQIVHTTEWNDSIDYAGKKVAIIGNGSTGVQLLSKVASEAASVTVYQRTPQWISPRAKYGEAISDELQWLIQTMPFYWNWNKYIAGFASNDLRELLIADEQWIADGGDVSKRNDAMREMLVGYIRDQVNDRADLVEKLVPDYPPMTRRPVVDNQWYASLTRDSVELVTTPIDRITDSAVQTADGARRETDLIIAAVGFQTEKFLWPTEYIGADGVSLEDVWKVQGAQAHLGMTVPGFPNLFMLYGPNSQPVASGAGLPIWLETWCSYIAELILQMLDNGYGSTVIRREAFDHYNEQLHKEASRLIYLSQTSATRKNYYVNKWGRLQVSAPWDGEEYFGMCVHPHPGDFDFEFASAE